LFSFCCFIFVRREERERVRGEEGEVGGRGGRRERWEEGEGERRGEGREWCGV
jgi:hypothetical protein